MVPGGIFLAMQAMRLRPLRRLPIAFGRLAKRPLPDQLDRWLRPLQQLRNVIDDPEASGNDRFVALDLLKNLHSAAFAEGSGGLVGLLIGGGLTHPHLK
jgi:hypothetical protein